MATSCSVCKQPIPIVFLEKIRGTYVKDDKGKQQAICSACQKSGAVEKMKK